MKVYFPSNSSLYVGYPTEDGYNFKVIDIRAGSYTITPNESNYTFELMGNPVATIQDILESGGYIKGLETEYLQKTCPRCSGRGYVWNALNGGFEDCDCENGIIVEKNPDYQGETPQGDSWPF
jgi:hypothetical protein